MFGSHILKLFHISLMSVKFTPFKRGRFLQLHKLNYSYREIEKIAGVSKINLLISTWSYLLKNQIVDIPGSANTFDKLWEAAQKVWEEITPEEIRKFTGTMQDWVEAVTKANGWHTKYWIGLHIWN